MSKQPIAPNVRESDPFGPCCADCLGLVYLAKIQSGPRIGVRATYRHVDSHPPCLTRKQAEA